MKRPQSAKQTKNYRAHISNDECSEDDSIPFMRLNKKPLINIGSMSNDLSRLLPKRIPHDKERLYYQTLQLKSNLNEFTEENLRLKTRVAILEKEKDQLKKVDKERLGGRIGTVGNSDKENAVVLNLKKLVRESKEQSEKTRAEMEKLKRTIRYTKLNEVEVEKQTIYQQNKKQAKVIVQLQTQLSQRVRYQEQSGDLWKQLKMKMGEVTEVTRDNAKYEELLEQMELRNKELSEKVLVLEKKMQRDLAVEKRKVVHLNKMIEVLRNENKVMSERLEEEKNKKPKGTLRPASSNPSSTSSQSLGLNKNVKEKQDAIHRNQKLKKQLQEAKRKLAESESQLKEQTENDTFNISSQPFELVLTKTQGQTFFGGPAINTNKKEALKQQNQVEQASSSKILQEIKEILTYKMKYNRYTFQELKMDIEGSPIKTFAPSDLLAMLTEEPFSFTQHHATQFLKVCCGSSRQPKNSQIEASTLIRYLRLVIEQFELMAEEEEEKMLYRIADFMTKHRSALETEFEKLKTKGKLVSKRQVQAALGKWKELSNAQIDLAICYVAVGSQSLEKINYCDLLDKFFINSSISMDRGNDGLREDLSLGENEELGAEEVLQDDEII